MAAETVLTGRGGGGLVSLVVEVNVGMIEDDVEVKVQLKRKVEEKEGEVHTAHPPPREPLSERRI